MTEPSIVARQSAAVFALALLGTGTTSAQVASEATQKNIGGPLYATVEGHPVESRPPEKADDAPLFPKQTRAPFHRSVPYKVTVLTDRLQAPWGMAILPGGDVLVTERLPGAFRIVSSMGDVSEPLLGLSDLPHRGQIGLLDVVVAPDFARSHRIFFTYFEWIERGVGDTRVASAQLEDGQLVDVNIIFWSDPDRAPQTNLAAGTKTGGRIAIGRDGLLYVTIGDRDAAGSAPWTVAQQLDNDLGKIIRITQDGKPAPDNPFAATPGARPEIWAYGQRSQEGLAFDAQGQLWETEHGPRGGDELNLIRPGANYGWPVITHGVDYSGKPVGAGSTAHTGMEQPVYYWDPVIAPSGLAFYQGNLFPAWRGSVLVGGLRGVLLDRLTLLKGKVVAEEPLLTDVHARVRDVRVGFDGAIYVITDSGGMAISDHTPSTSKLIVVRPQ